MTMRRLIYSMTVSLDGFIAGPDGAIDWSVPDEELFRFHTQQVRETGMQLCGRRLYETMVYWETAEESSLDRGARRVRPDLEGPAKGRVLHDAGERGGQHQAGQGRRRRGGLEAQGTARKGHRRRRCRPRPRVYEAGADRRVAAVRQPGPTRRRHALLPAPGRSRINLELVETRTFGSRVVYLRYRRVPEVL